MFTPDDVVHHSVLRSHQAVQQAENVACCAEWSTSAESGGSTAAVRIFFQRKFTASRSEIPLLNHTFILNGVIQCEVMLVRIGDDVQMVTRRAARCLPYVCIECVFSS